MVKNLLPPPGKNYLIFTSLLTVVLIYSFRRMEELLNLVILMYQKLPKQDLSVLKLVHPTTRHQKYGKISHMDQNPIFEV